MKLLPTLQNILKSLKIALSLSALTFLPACVSSSWIRQADSSVPVEAVHSGSGTVMSFRAHTTGDRLYVAGRAKPHQLRRPMRVDVQLIGADGRVVAQKSDELDTPKHLRLSSGRHGHNTYVASFPLSQARRAVKIRVVYHEFDHSDS
jgi:hypothetical protein